MEEESSVTEVLAGTTCGKRPLPCLGRGVGAILGESMKVLFGAHLV